MPNQSKDLHARVDNLQTADLSTPGRNIFFAAVSTTRMPMTVTDPNQPDNPIIFANPAFLSMTGYEADEIYGRNCRFLQGPDTDRNVVAQVAQAITEERDVSVELLNYRKDGSSFWNALFVSPVYNEAGKLTYFFASQLDISRRKDAEDALRHAQKMEALGQLTGGIAHDFNNLLQVMGGYVDLSTRLAGKTVIDGEKIARHLAMTKNAIERASSLTQQLLAFSRKQKLQGRVINLNNLMEQTRQLVEQVTGGDVDFSSDLQEDLWNCRIDPTQAEVALFNIIANAKDALVGQAQPSINIETHNVEVDLANAKVYDGIAAGRYVCIAVADNGCGMPDSIKSRVMEPFFTTKEEGQGTGLGLSMVYGFAKQSGGAVRISSEEGVGTTIRLYFPADTAALTHYQEPRRTDAAAGTEAILIVEDREDVAALARAILDDCGYQTAVATNGPEALQRLSEGGHFDLLFSDVIMPGGMNGVELAREVSTRYPAMKILLTTGYAENAIARTDAEGKEFEVLPKPYPPHVLANRVRRALDGPDGVS